MHSPRLVSGAGLVAALLAAIAPPAHAETAQTFQREAARLPELQESLRRSAQGLAGLEARSMASTQKLQSLRHQLESAPMADPSALVQEVLRQAYIQATEDLRHYSEKTQYFNNVKSNLRNHLAALRAMQKNFPQARAGSLGASLAPLESSASELDRIGQSLQTVGTHLEQRVARFKAVTASKGNTREAVLIALKESIQEMNEDKKYVLTTLKQVNAQAEALAENSKRLADASAALAAAEKDADKPATRGGTTSSSDRSPARPIRPR